MFLVKLSHNSEWDKNTGLHYIPGPIIRGKSHVFKWFQKTNKVKAIWTLGESQYNRKEHDSKST